MPEIIDQPIINTPVINKKIIPKKLNTKKQIKKKQIKKKQIGLHKVFTWEKKESLYNVHLICDLFNNFEVIIKKGLKHEHPKTTTEIYQTEQQALEAIAKLKVKLSRLGYHQVFS